MLTKHLYAANPTLPPFGSFLCEYVTAANGVFVRARRNGLEAMLPVCLSFNGAIRDLYPQAPYVRLTNGRISAPVIAQAVDWMAAAAPLELLTWVNYDASRFSLVKPEQTMTETSCKPNDPFGLDGQNALLDFHSHGRACPFFSEQDDRDERIGFRLFAVAGCFPNPKILVRVGIYGHFWQIPPDWVMEVPENLSWAVEGGIPCLD